MGLLLGGTGCRKAPEAPPTPITGTAPIAHPRPAWLDDATETAGLNFVHDVGPVGSYFMPESLGSGVAIFDFDGDGRMDVLLLQNAGTNSTARHQLFHQTSDGRFSDVGSGSGLDLPGRGMGVAVGDVDNDGKPDAFNRVRAGIFKIGQRPPGWRRRPGGARASALCSAISTMTARRT